MSRYEVRDDGTGARWDWLNVLSASFPYTVYEWREDTYAKWWYAGCESTMRAARRRIQRTEGLKRGGTVVYRESGGKPELPDLREYALRHGTGAV